MAKMDAYSLLCISIVQPHVEHRQMGSRIMAHK